MAKTTKDEVSTDAVVETAADTTVAVTVAEEKTLAKEVLIQYIKAVKARAENIEKGGTMNTDTINTLNCMRESVTLLHGMGLFD